MRLGTWQKVYVWCSPTPYGSQPPAKHILPGICLLSSVSCLRPTTASSTHSPNHSTLRPCDRYPNPSPTAAAPPPLRRDDECARRNSPAIAATDRAPGPSPPATAAADAGPD